MSYLVLARQYRPKNFSQLVGQEHVVQALSNALTSQRLHHAYLFTGTRGVGKTTVSRILAKSLNCMGADGQGSITATPCGVCQACADIDSGRFVDYTELDAASNRGVDEVQQLLEQAVYKPVQGRFKVFMIDEVHMLTGHAFNAMLKTLEEPPEYLKFVLATTDPQKVPVTVLSRCLQFNLRPMAPQTIHSHLEQVLGQEQVTFDPGALRLLSKAARGSMRDALSLTDQAIAFGAGALSETTVRQMLGAVDDQYVFDLLQALGGGDGGRVIDVIQNLRRSGLNVGSTLDQMLDALHRMAVYQASSVAADKTDAPELFALSQQWPADETQLLYSLCLHGRAELHLSPDDYAALTMILLRQLAFKPNDVGASVGGAVAPEKKPEAASNAMAGSRPSLTTLPVRLQSEPNARTEPRKHFTIEAPGSPPRGFGSFEATSNIKNTTPTDVDRADVSRSNFPGGTLSFSPIESLPWGDFWFEVVQELLSANSLVGMARELVLQSALLSKEDSVWTLQVESDLLTQPNNVEKVRSALQHARADCAHNWLLRVQVGDAKDTVAKRLAYAAALEQITAQEIVMKDVGVQQLMREFGAKVVSGSIRVVAIA